MKVIIAGGRNYRLIKEEKNLLVSLHEDYSFTEIISGTARGVDTEGELFAEIMGIPVKKFPANWDKFGKKAGIIRNLEMAEYADAVILFNGGTGTQNMFEQAGKLGLIIFDLRD